MQPWILEQVAREHRRDLLAQADRVRLVHRQSAQAPKTVGTATPTAGASAIAGLSRIWLRRRAGRAQCGDAAATSAARYAS
jgi:hypothetical protein